MKTLLATIGLALLADASCVEAASSLTELCGDCQPRKVATCGGFLEGPAVGADGRVWVVDVLGDRIMEVLPEGKCVEAIKTSGHPNGVKVLPDGKLLVAEHTGLFRYDPANGQGEQLNTEFYGEKLLGLNDLSLDSHGGTYFTAPAGSSVLKPTGRVFYRSSDGTIVLVAEKLAFPNGVAVARDGASILVSEFAAKRILSIPAVDAKGPFAVAYVFAQTDGGIGVDGMALDGRGDLLAANLGAGEMLVYDRAARLIGAIHMPAGSGDLVTNVAIAPDAIYVTEARKGEVWRVKLAGRK